MQRIIRTLFFLCSLVIKQMSLSFILCIIEPPVDCLSGIASAAGFKTFFKTKKQMFSKVSTQLYWPSLPWGKLLTSYCQSITQTKLPRMARFYLHILKFPLAVELDPVTWFTAWTVTI